MGKYILALDQGTSYSNAVLVDKQGKVVSQVKKEFEQYYPTTGWREHDPNEIWLSQYSVAIEAMEEVGITGDSIVAIGITNQRETTIVWNKETGDVLYNAIVWQDKRTSDICDALKEKGYEEIIRKKTGLLLDPYFSATKIMWILDNVEGARELADSDKLAFGTVDSWLVWKFTKGKLHITDITNASRTMLFNISTQEWDKELLEFFGVRESMLPKVVSNSEVYGFIDSEFFGKEIPIAGLIGDQQAAMFGQLCVDKGMLKNTYSTGNFIMMHTGDEPVFAGENLLATVALKMNGVVSYALEGSVFDTGSVVQWLRDGLNIIDSSSEILQLANSEQDNGGVYFVPAFSGLGAPYWDKNARGAIFGITIGTSNGHIARAALESIVFQSMGVIAEIKKNTNIPITELRVDGAFVNDTLLQTQADLIDSPVVSLDSSNVTGLGVAYLAGLAVGIWSNIEEIKTFRHKGRVFYKDENVIKINKSYEIWKKAVERSLNWL